MNVLLDNQLDKDTNFLTNQAYTAMEQSAFAFVLHLGGTETLQIL